MKDVNPGPDSGGALYSLFMHDSIIRRYSQRKLEVLNISNTLINILHLHIFTAAARWAEVIIMSKSYVYLVCVCV